VFLAFVAVIGFATAIEYLRVEEDFRVARFEAIRLGKTPESYERPRIHLLTQLNALLAGARIQPHPRMADEEIELARKVALRFPWPATQNRYALALALNGNSAEALRQLQVIRTLHGVETYQHIKENWAALTKERHPALAEIKLP
jgi:hypothetical protein